MAGKNGYKIKTNVDLTAFLSFSIIFHFHSQHWGDNGRREKNLKQKQKGKGNIPNVIWLSKDPHNIRLWKNASVLLDDHSWNPFCFGLSDSGSNSVSLPANTQHIFVAMLVIQDLNIFFPNCICLSFKGYEFNSPYLLLKPFLVMLSC